MAFRFASDSYLWPVKFRRPVDGGVYEDVEFTVRFKRFPRDKRMEYLEGLIVDGKATRTDDDIVFQLLDGFGSDVFDADGETPMPFNKKNILKLLNEEYVAIAICDAWKFSLFEGPAKN